jgi:ABC-type polysaccharide/polyol phosphate transport system ATPase subunit
MPALLPSASVTVTLRDAGSAESPLAGSGAPAVALSHVSKGFRLPHEQYHTLKERALHPFRNRTFDLLQAVEDVTVEIKTGEFFGIVGRNGSGKSTLLKCLAGIYDTDAGSIEIRGRLSPFIELGVGFNPDLAARDNVLINAIMLGLSRSEARERFDSIVEFAELEQFMDLKLKNYSSGMQVRLAFSVAIQVDAEILLVDEVLAVGDASFQQKCFDEFTRLKSSGQTIIFVTHDMSSIEKFCDRAMLMERGQVVDIGDPAKIARQYNELNFPRMTPTESLERRSSTSGGSPVVELVGAAFESPTGELVTSAAQGEACCVRLDARFHSDVEDPLFAISLRDELGHISFATSTQLGYGATGSFHIDELAVVRIRFDNWLAPGRYQLTAAISRNGPGADNYELREDISSLIVHASQHGGGAVDLPHTFEIERSR